MKISDQRRKGCFRRQFLAIPRRQCSDGSGQVVGDAGVDDGPAQQQDDRNGEGNENEQEYGQNERSRTQMTAAFRGSKLPRQVARRCRRGEGRHLPPLTECFYFANHTLNRSRRLSPLSAQNFASTMKPVFILSGLVGRSFLTFGFVLAIASLLPGP